MAIIKLAEYTFDNTLADCYPYIIPSNVTVTKEDTVDGNITTRILSTESETPVTKIQFAVGSINHKNSLLTVEYLNMKNITDMSNTFNYCQNVSYINTDGWGVNNVTTFEGCFSECYNLANINVANINVSKAENVCKMFHACTSLTSLDLSSWDTGSCKNMSFMFQNCSSLTSLDLSNFNTSKVTSMGNMFSNCNSLTSLNLSSFDISKVTNMEYMLSNTSIVNLDLSSFKITDNCNINYLFIDNRSLESIDISNFQKTNDFAYVLRYTSNLKTIGMLYSSTDAVNKFASMVNVSSATHHTDGLTIYYHDADPTQLTPVDGVTFVKYEFPTTISLPPHVSLYSLPDGTRDELDVKTGVLTHNTGECTWDDSTVGWGVSIGEGSTTFYHLRDWGAPNYGTIQQDMDLPLEINGNNTIVISPNIIGIEVWGNAELGRMNVHVPMEFNNENEAKQWLKENQVTFIYRKETPTTEKLILNYNHSCDYGMVLPKGAVDRYDVLTGQYNQNIASIELNGADAWHSIEEFNKCVKIGLEGVHALGIKAGGGLYCDNDLFPNIDDNSDVEHCVVDPTTGGRFYFYIDKNRLSSPDLIGWQIWLQQNPFTMYYELAETKVLDKSYEELDPELARWEMMDSVKEGTISYTSNNNDNLTLYPNMTYVAPSVNNFDVEVLEPNTTYTVYAENVGGSLNLGGNTSNFTSGTTFTSGENKWLTFNSSPDVENIMLIKGDTTDEVVPYFKGTESVRVPSVTTTKDNKMNILSTSSDVILRSNGDVKDEYNAKTGELTQRIGENGEILPQEIIRQVGFNIEYKESDKKYLVDVFDGITYVNVSSDVSPSIVDIVYFTNEDTLATITTDSATVTDAKADTYIQRAILKGNTGYRDIDTGEFLETFEEGRNLELVSVKMPVLTTANCLKVLGNEEIVNIYNAMGYSNVKAELSVNGKFVFIQNGMYAEPTKVWQLEPDTTYTFQATGDGVIDLPYFTNGLWINGTNKDYSNKIFQLVGSTDSTGLFGLQIMFDTNKEVDFNVFKGNYLEQAIEPSDIKTNILTLNEPIELRGIGDVQDELDCLNGEVVTRIKELNLKEITNWWMYTNSEINETVAFYCNVSTFMKNYASNPNSLLCNSLPVAVGDTVTSSGYECIGIGGAYLKIRIAKSKLSEISTNGLINYLNQNDIIIVGYSASESIKTVDLTLTKQGIDELQIKQLQAYENGQILLSSESGMLPTMIYSLPSSNAFRLPSMRTGTRYTLKYPSASGSIGIGEINYKITGPSMLFTTPLTIKGDTTSIVFTDDDPQDVMLIEGDYSKREIPFFTGMRSSENIVITTRKDDANHTVQTQTTLRALPNGAADKLDLVSGQLLRVTGIRNYQEGDLLNRDVFTDQVKTVYPLSTPTVTTINPLNPMAYAEGSVELASDALIPTLHYRLPSSNNFILELLKPETRYTLYANYEQSGSFTLGGTLTQSIGNAKTFTTTDTLTDSYLTFDGDLGLSNVMLIEGDSRELTVPYFNGLLSVENATVKVNGSLTEVNRVVLPNTIKLRSLDSLIDELDLITGVYTKRIEYKRLTGNESWQLGAIDTKQYISFKLVCEELKAATLTNLYCDRFNSLAWTSLTDQAFEFVTGSGTIEINIRKDRLSTPNIAGFKRWLSQYPTTVHYELAQPNITTLTLPWSSKPVSSFYGNTTIQTSVSQSLKPYLQVIIATTTLEDIVSDLKEKNASLEEENLSTMMAVTEVFEMIMYIMPSEATTINIGAPMKARHSSDKGGFQMVEVYVTLIIKGKKTLEQVPAIIRPQVEAQLIELGVLEA